MHKLTLRTVENATSPERRQPISLRTGNREFTHGAAEFYSRRAHDYTPQVWIAAHHCSLAMLDSDGIVVAWYDDSTDSSRVGVHVVDRHVSQFYVPADLAANLPGVNLLSAAICGGNTQQGWRRQPGGAIVWAMTVIEAVVLKDGRLQGFTHVVRTAEGPRAEPPIQMPQPSFRKSTNVRWGMNRAPIGVSHASAAA